VKVILFSFCECVCTRQVSCQGATQDTPHHLEEVIHYLYGLGEQVSLCMVNVTWTHLNTFAFILNFFIRFWIAFRLACSFCEAMPESLYIASTAVLPANAACSLLAEETTWQQTCSPAMAVVLLPLYIAVPWQWV
jgi:hypothetical protein